jgi:integrase
VAKKALSDAAVKRYKPPKTGQEDVFDMGYPGFALRVSYGGAKSWVFFYWLGNRQRRLTLGHYPSTSLGKAREKWRKAKEDVSCGRDPAHSDTTGDNFETVAREWLKRDQADNKSLGEVQRIVEKEMLPAWGHRSIKDVRRHDALVLVDAIVDRGSPTMARRTIAYIHRLFRWAVSQGIIESNPAADLPKPGRETRRDRVLSDDELKKVWKAAHKFGWPYGTALQLLILTGARRAEISELTWDEINGDTIELDGKRTKNGQPHNIPLSEPARRILEETPRIAGSEFVFGKPLRSGAWSQAKKNFPVKVAGWRIHDLRRTVATGLQRLGVSLQVIEAVLGHTSGSRSGVVDIYQRHSFDAEKRTALDTWGEHVIALIE